MVTWSQRWRRHVTVAGPFNWHSEPWQRNETTVLSALRVCLRHHSHPTARCIHHLLPGRHHPSHLTSLLSVTRVMQMCVCRMTQNVWSNIIIIKHFEAVGPRPVIGTNINRLDSVSSTVHVHTKYFSFTSLLTSFDDIVLSSFVRTRTARRMKQTKT